MRGVLTRPRVLLFGLLVMLAMVLCSPANIVGGGGGALADQTFVAEALMPGGFALEALMPGEVVADSTAPGIAAITVTEEARLSAQAQGTNTPLVLAAAFLLSVAVLARSRLRRAFTTFKRGGYQLITSITSTLYLRRALAGHSL